MLSRVFVFALLLTCFCISGQQNNVATQLKQCYLEDKTKFENCLLTFWRELIGSFKTGIPELNVPVMDPMFINFAEFKDQGAALHANVKFYNVSVAGASNIAATSTHVDTEGRFVTVNGTVPHVNCTGNYTMKGNILFLPADSSGRFAVNMSGVELFLKSYPVQRGTGIRTDKTKIEIATKDVVVKLDYLLGGDEVGQALSALISENSLQLFQDLKPMLSRQLEKKFQELTADIFNDVPAEAFFS